MRRRFLLTLPFILFGIFLAGLLWAAGEKDAPISVESETIASRYGKDGRVTIYTYATITQAEMKVTADTAISTGRKEKFTFACTGHPVFTDPGNVITAGRIDLTPKTRTVTCTVNASMVITRRGKDKNQPATTSTLSGDTLVYDYAKRTAVASGHVSVETNGETRTGDTGTYDVRTGKLEVLKIAPKEEPTTPPA